MSVRALRHIRRMRGGAQSHLMRCSDGNLYVVKFQNNPQGIRVLANEQFATRLAESVGLPVPQTEIVEVDDRLIERTPELSIQLAHGTTKCVAGMQFGSMYVADPPYEAVLDHMPAELLHSRVRNLDAFAGILVLDKWTGNIDGRQAAFCRRSRERLYTAVFIDQGYCFNAECWTFPDYPLRGIYGHHEVYSSVRGWKSFEPWLSRIEQFPPDQIRAIANRIPAEWYGGEQSCLDNLVEELVARRGIVRGLIQTLRISPCRPFPLWTEIRASSSSGIGESHLMSR